MLLTIIVTCYNKAPYIEATLHSIYSQTFKEWQCIIIDDGSADDSPAIIEKFIGNKLQFVFYKQQNIGVSKTRNKYGLQATTPYLLFVDGDDLLVENYLENAISIFNHNECLKVVSPKFAFLKNQLLQPFHQENYSFTNLVLHKYIMVVSSVIKSADFIALKGFDEQMVNGYEDWEFWIRLLKNKGKVVETKECMFHYRILDNSRNRSIATRKELIDYVYHKHLSDLAPLLENPITLTKQLADAEAKVKIYENLPIIKQLLKLKNTSLRKYFINKKFIF